MDWTVFGFDDTRWWLIATQAGDKHSDTEDRYRALPSTKLTNLLLS